ncbi:MAG TPA: DUF3352 domain-containing protein [Pyrinomonadaceae bacterium]|nr:DUF3352 domain-containing protein [Pyrinomonadaceae bacterium]
MKSPIPFNTLTAVLIVLSLLSSPLIGQTRRANAPRNTRQSPVSPTFDNLLSADSYKLYVEVRGVGQVIRSVGVNDLLEPVIKLAAPPKQFSAFLKWLQDQSETLTSSRLLLATWPTRPKLPTVVCAIEFSSVDEAHKFETQANRFLPQMFPAPTPAPTVSPSLPQSPVSAPGDAAKPVAVVSDVKREAAMPFVITQNGSLVILSDSPLTFESLRPKGSKLLSEDQNFRISRNRFNSEPLFLYFNISQEDLVSPQVVATAPPTTSSAVPEVKAPETPTDRAAEAGVTGQPVPDPLNPPNPVPVAEPQDSPASQAPEPVPTKAATLLTQFSQLLLNAPPRWPDVLSLAIEFEPNSYVLRALFLNSGENRGIIIPFIPQLISGAPISPAAPSILPSDSQLVLSLSLDFNQIYDQMAQAASDRETLPPGQNVRANQPISESPFAAYEKMLGVDLKRDLVPLLGNEVAVSLPIETFIRGARQSGENTSATKPPAINPILAISIKDREATRQLITRMIKGLGLEFANLFAHTERRDDTEVISYAGVFSYAFIGDFLVSSTDPKQVSRVVESYLKRETLGSSSDFRNFTRWQPRQVLGQLYISPAVADISAIFDPKSSAGLDPKLRDFMMGLNPEAAPITYAMSNEGYGPLHEIHLPKNLIVLWLAGASGSSFSPTLEQNEVLAQTLLRGIAAAETTYFKGKGAGRFASINELVAENLVTSDISEKYGYRFEVTPSGTAFEARATPVEYGRTGKMSFLIDESAVLRGADHGGGSATIADKPLQ